MPSFGRQAAAGDTSADVVHSFRVNAVLPDGAVEAREQTLAYQVRAMRPAAVPAGPGGAVG